MRKPTPLPERILNSTDRETGCWLWKLAVNNRGYAMIRTRDRKMTLAHRVSYEVHIGPIPDGLVIDHLCRNRTCVNPAHLRAVTPKQNSEHKAADSHKARSGVRGVVWHVATRKWMSQVRHNGKQHVGGFHSTIEEAGGRVRELRNELFTHNDLDRGDG